jgi:hypothetical protein
LDLWSGARSPGLQQSVFRSSRFPPSTNPFGNRAKRSVIIAFGNHNRRSDLSDCTRNPYYRRAVSVCQYDNIEVSTLVPGYRQSLRQGQRRPPAFVVTVFDVRGGFDPAHCAWMCARMSLSTPLCAAICSKYVRILRIYRYF